MTNKRSAQAAALLPRFRWLRWSPTFSYSSNVRLDDPGAELHAVANENHDARTELMGLLEEGHLDLPDGTRLEHRGATFRLSGPAQALRIFLSSLAPSTD